MLEDLDRGSFVLVYVSGSNKDLPTFMGVWHGNYEKRGDEASIGTAIRQGLAGFSKNATWKDLTEQLESAGFRRAGRVGLDADVVSVHDVMRGGQDVVRVVFLADGLINCQWLTSGPDDNEAAAEKPIGIWPPEHGREVKPS